MLWRLRLRPPLHVGGRLDSIVQGLSKLRVCGPGHTSNTYQRDLNFLGFILEGWFNILNIFFVLNNALSNSSACILVTRLPLFVYLKQLLRG